MHLMRTYPSTQHQVLIPVPPTDESRRRPVVKHNTIVPKYNFVLSAATDLHHRAVTKISAAWRGFFLRRRLEAAKITLAFHQRKATVIQCFVRRVVAKRRVRILRAQREELCDERVNVHHRQRLKECAAGMKWQLSQYEAAAVKLQQLFRWFLRYKVGAATAEECPARVYKYKQFLPDNYRRHGVRRMLQVLPIGGGFEGNIGADPSPRHDSRGSLLPAPPRSGLPSEAVDSPTRNSAMVPYNRDSRQLVVMSPHPPQSTRRFAGPPIQAEVEAINSRMRQRRSDTEQLLRSDREQKRKQERMESIVSQDMNGCAGVLQRRFRVVAAKQSLHSRQCLKEYWDRYATIIQCAFRSFIARMRAAKYKKDIASDIWLATRKYGVAQVERLKTEFSWNANIMRRAATVIQTAYRRRVYIKSYSVTPPTGSRSQSPTVQPGVVVVRRAAQDVRSTAPFAAYLAKCPHKLPTGLLKECPEHWIAQEKPTDDSDRRQKYVFRRHKDPSARKAHLEALAQCKPPVAQQVDAPSIEKESQEAPVCSDVAAQEVAETRPESLPENDSGEPAVAASTDGDASREPRCDDSAIVEQDAAVGCAIDDEAENDAREANSIGIAASTAADGGDNANEIATSAVGETDTALLCAPGATEDAGSAAAPLDAIAEADEEFAPTAEAAATTSVAEEPLEEHQAPRPPLDDANDSPASIVNAEEQQNVADVRPTSSRADDSVVSSKKPHRQPLINAAEVGSQENAAVDDVPPAADAAAGG